VALAFAHLAPPLPCPDGLFVHLHLVRRHLLRRGGQSPEGEGLHLPVAGLWALGRDDSNYFSGALCPLVHGSLWAFERKARQRVIRDRRTRHGRGQRQDRLIHKARRRQKRRGKQKDAGEDARSEHKLAFHSMDSSEDGEGRRGLFWDAAATPEGLLGGSRWGGGERDTRKHDTNLPLHPSYNAPGTPRSGSWSSWTPWKKSPKKDGTEKQRAWQRRPYVRPVTLDELQHLREELLGEAVEEAEFEEAVDEAACEEEEEWVSFQDAEQMSV